MSDEEKESAEAFVAFVKALRAEAWRELVELAKRDREYGEDVRAERRAKG